MTQKEFVALLKTLELPVSYGEFKVKKNAKVELPYIVYYYKNSDNFIADGVVYEKFNRVIVELYTDKKELEIQEKLECVLDNAEIIYQCDEVYIKSEKMYLNKYEMRL